MQGRADAREGAPVNPGAHWQRLEMHSPCGALQPLGHAPKEHEAPGQEQERRGVKGGQGGKGGKGGKGPAKGEGMGEGMGEGGRGWAGLGTSEAVLAGTCAILADSMTGAVGGACLERAVEACHRTCREGGHGVQGGGGMTCRGKGWALRQGERVRG